MKPVLDSFSILFPEINIVYNEFDTIELYDLVNQEAFDTPPDLVISSAMDLQVKLANDGYAQVFRDPVTETLPAGSSWRSETFGFTYEPIVFVYNKAAFENIEIPRTHNELVDLLRDESVLFNGRVGTYDIRLSGIGYLFATQDELRSSVTWRLNESLGRVSARVFCCSSQILESIAKGDLIFGYNILSSYAMEFVTRDPRVGVVFPEDYTLTISRIAFIHKQAPNVSDAQKFLRYLLSNEGQQVIANNGGLLSIRSNISGPFTLSGLEKSNSLNLHIINQGPPLLIYLDQSKRKLFIKEWEDALLFNEEMTKD